MDARLADGSRLNAVIKPAALNGPLVSIRRIGCGPLTVEDLLDERIGHVRDARIPFRLRQIPHQHHRLRRDQGSGKTTLLNAPSRYIRTTERIVTIEDTAELQLQQPHVAKMEAQPVDLEGEGAVSV